MRITLALHEFLKNEERYKGFMKRAVSKALERETTLHEIIRSVEEELKTHVLFACIAHSKSICGIIAGSAKDSINFLWIAEWAVDTYANEHQLDKLKGRL